MPDSTDQVLKMEVDDERDRNVYAHGFIPGWIGEGGLRPEPKRDFFPHCWSWRDGRALLSDAVEYVDPAKSERRNIRMANPAAGKRTSLNTIHCSYQMVAPGEFARAHRHTVNAGRFILESEGAFTTLNGKRLSMNTNDVVLTANWDWHGLGNESTSEPAAWIDFLDDPLAQTLNTVFFEVQPKIEGDLPVSERSPYLIRWADVQEKLKNAPVDPTQRRGRRIQLDSGPIPTMALYMEHFDAGQTTQPFKTTASQLFICAEGEGTTEIDGQSFAWTHGDVVAVPPWMDFRHCAASDATLFSLTDEPVMRAVGWLREAPG